MRALITKPRYTTVIPAFAGIQIVLVAANSGFRHPPMADIFDFRRSICVGCQGFGWFWFQGAVALEGCQGVPRRATAWSCSSSLRITATRATFPALPRCRSPW